MEKSNPGMKDMKDKESLQKIKSEVQLGNLRIYIRNYCVLSGVAHCGDM